MAAVPGPKASGASKALHGDVGWDAKVPSPSDCATSSHDTTDAVRRARVTLLQSVAGVDVDKSGPKDSDFFLSTDADLVAGSARGERRAEELSSLDVFECIAVSVAAPPGSGLGACTRSA